MESSKRVMLVLELDEQNHAEVVFTKELIQNISSNKFLLISLHDALSVLSIIIYVIIFHILSSWH